MVRTKRFELSCIAHRFLRPAVSTNSTTLALNCLEEAVGFEPTDRFQPADFKSAAIDHSATFPKYDTSSFRLEKQSVLTPHNVQRYE